MKRTPAVILISMPWTTLMEPSLGLGILRATLNHAGISARVRHLNLQLLRWLTPATYLSIANVFALNDFLFSGVLDPDVTPHQQRWLREKTLELLTPGLIDDMAHGGVDGLVDKLLHLRREIIPTWVDEMADEIAATGATLAGFTCMFDQTIASAALAKRIRERSPGILLALGGYAVRPPTAAALMQAFPWIDAICTGEGEPSIVPLARASAGQIPLEEAPGLLVRTATGVHRTLPAPAMNMDDVPIPDYDDFFDDISALSAEHAVDVTLSRLPLENSRGCWWGAVHHCVFCGIHDDDMRFRTRSAEKVLETLDTLAARHGVRSFRFADYILPHNYTRTLLPELIRRGAPYQITCEVKANFTASRFAQLAEAGFTAVQPGVESFSTGVLRRMDKGVTAIQNVHTLLLGRRHGVYIDYNILYGLPADEEADYREMLRQMPRLVHLDPPETHIQVQITRYAPLQSDPERFGIEASPHAPAYELVFSRAYLEQTGFDLDAYCYYFDRPFENPPRLVRLFREVDRSIEAWRRAREQRAPILAYRACDDGLEIVDTRSLPERRYALDARAAALLRAAEEPVLADHLAQLVPDGTSVLEQLDGHGLLFRDGPRVISLALPLQEEPSAAREPWSTHLPHAATTM